MANTARTRGDGFSTPPAAYRCEDEVMVDLRHPVSVAEHDLELAAQRHPWNQEFGRASKTALSPLKDLILNKAVEEEADYVPWLDKIEEIGAEGKALVNLRQTTIEVDWGSFDDSDHCECEGWLAAFQNNRAAACELMTSLVMREPPARPNHWPSGSLVNNHVGYGRDSPFGNVDTKRSPLTALAVAIVLEDRVARGLQTALFESVRFGYPTYSEFEAVIIRWADVSSIPESLESAVGMALAENPSVRSLGGAPNIEIIRNIQSLILKVEEESEHFASLALKDDLCNLARMNPGAIALAVPWFLAAQTKTHDNLLMTMAYENANVLESAKKHGMLDGPVATRAQGLALAVNEGDGSSLADTLIWWLDKESYSVPQPLAAPTSTWLDDVILEKEIRDRTNASVTRLNGDGLSEETEVTGALINELINAFKRDRPLPQTAAKDAPLKVSITSTNSQTHERDSGADLGIVLRIDVPNRLRVESGHLVQIKQAMRRNDKDSVPSWKIELKQLTSILKHDPTATYWLIQLHKSPKVFSVPAKYLHALASARSSQASLTVTYPQVRSSSVDLGSEIMDLLIGQWIGIAESQAVDLASGLDSKHKPAHFIELTVEAFG